MNKTIIIAVLFALSSCTVSKEAETKQLTGDTIPTILAITNSKLARPQFVAGYKVVKDSNVVGFLSVRKKQFSNRIKVWSYQ